MIPASLLFVCVRCRSGVFLNPEWTSSLGLHGVCRWQALNCRHHLSTIFPSCTCNSLFLFLFSPGCFVLCFCRKLPLLYKNSRYWLTVDCLNPHMPTTVVHFANTLCLCCLSTFPDHRAQGSDYGPPLLCGSSVDLCDTILSHFPKLSVLPYYVGWLVQFI